MPTLPIVGSYYRPPAKAILEVLAQGTMLELCPEPDNPTDPNAIQVWVSSASIPEGPAQDKLASSAPLWGFELSEILAQEKWHLGYVPRTAASELAPTLAGKCIVATLSFASNGLAQVTFKLPPTSVK